VAGRFNPTRVRLKLQTRRQAETVAGRFNPTRVRLKRLI